MKSCSPNWVARGIAGACLLLLPLHCQGADYVEIRLKIELATIDQQTPIRGKTPDVGGGLPD